MMRIEKLIMLGILLFTVVTGFAQTTSIQGTVTTADGKAISGATITIKNTKRGTVTDASGNYSIHNLNSNTYSIAVSAVGWAGAVKHVHLTRDTNATVNFVLEKNTIQLDDVVVNGKYYKKYRADDLSSSLRLETPLLQTPQNISIITHAALIDQQVLTMSDGVLRNVSGATRQEHWGEMYTRVNMRGARAGAFYNGVNVSSQWGPLSEDMSYVDRIEFVKGPAGFLMSNGEPSGIYNVVTKKPTGKAFGGMARMTMGSFGLYRAEADIDAAINHHFAVRLNVMGQNAQSFRQYDFNNRYIIAPSVLYRLSKKTKLTAEYIHQVYTTQDVGSPYVFNVEGFKIKPRSYSMSDPGLPPTKITEQYANINAQHDFNKDWKLTTQLSHLYAYMLGTDSWAEKVLSGGLVQRNVNVWESKNTQTFGQVFLNGTFNTGAVAHKTLIGLDVGSKKYIADWSQSHKLDKEDALFNLNASNYTPPSNGYPKFDLSRPLEQRATPSGTIVQEYTGLYIQDELGFWNNKIRLTLASRLTDVKQSAYGRGEQKATKITPRLGLSASITKDFAAYAVYDQSFLPQSGFLRNGEKVLPITGSNMEVGLKKDWLGGKWNTGISIYQITKSNELTADPANKPNEKYSIVKGESVAKGLEFDLKGEVAPGLNMILNYAYTDNTITKSNVPQLAVGSKIAGYATHTANGWLHYAIEDGVLKGLGASAGFTYMAGRTSWAPWGTSLPILQMDDYLKFDGGAFWQAKKTKITLNVFNIADAYLYSGANYASFYYYQAEAPRNWRLTVAYKF